MHLMKQWSSCLQLIFSLVFKIIFKIVQIFCSFPLKAEVVQLLETLGLWHSNALLESHRVQRLEMKTHGSSSLWLWRCFLALLGFIQQSVFSRSKVPGTVSCSCPTLPLQWHRTSLWLVCSLEYLKWGASEQAGSCSLYSAVWIMKQTWL